MSTNIKTLIPVVGLIACVIAVAFISVSGSFSNTSVPQTAVSTERAAGCGGPGQAFTTELGNGSAGCGTFLTTQTLVSTEAPAGCPNPAMAFTTESANGAAGCATFLTTQTAVSTELAGTCSAASAVTRENANGSLNCGPFLPTPTVACDVGKYIHQVSGQDCEIPTNPQFYSNTNICTDTTLTTLRMAGFKINFTIPDSGGFIAVLSFEVNSSATSGLTSKFQPAFQTGANPVCNAGAGGTTVGNQYTVSTVAAVAMRNQYTVSFGFPDRTFTSGQQEWVDLQITDSSNAGWTYSNPQFSVIG